MTYRADTVSTWHKALGAAALFLGALGVAGGTLLSKAIEQGDLPTIAIMRSDQSLKRLAKSAPAPRPGQGGGQVAASAQARGVDATATAAISDGGACAGDQQSVLIFRSVGVEGVRVSAIGANGLPSCNTGK